jgi:hypothetical protein
VQLSVLKGTVNHGHCQTDDRLCRTLASLAVLVLVHQSYTTVNWQSGSAIRSTGRALLSLRSPHPNAVFALTESLPQWAKCVHMLLARSTRAWLLDQQR